MFLLSASTVQWGGGYERPTVLGGSIVADNRVRSWSIAYPDTEEGRRMVGRTIKRRIKLVRGILKQFSRGDVKDVAYFTKLHDRGRLKSRTILFENPAGAEMTGTPYDVFRKALTDDRFRSFRYFWAIEDDALRQRLALEYRAYRSVRFIARGGRSYMKVLATAKYLIADSIRPPFFIARSDQVYVHAFYAAPGAPGDQSVEEPFPPHGVLRSLLQADYVVSPDAEVTLAVRSRYRLDGVFGGVVLEVGPKDSDLAGVDSVSHLVDEVFFGAREESRRVLCASDKTRLLLYPGGLNNNGITEAFIALVDSIDHGTFDVTLLCKPPSTEEQDANLRRVNADVRILFSPTRANRLLSEALREQWTLRRGCYSVLDKRVYPARFYGREAKRCLGSARFDCVVDYSGYSMHWANLLNSVESARTVSYMHSDMLAEKDKVVDGRKVHYHSVKSLISVYSRSDAIANVSDRQKQINEKNLSAHVGGTPFVTVPNLINAARVWAGAADSSDVYQHRGRDVLVTGVTRGRVDAVPFPTSQDFTFLNMGRLSPEKGQIDLVTAFARIRERFPNTRLFIVGEGVLREELSDTIRALGLGESVALVGQLDNPFHLLKHADVFILSSHYEGQPLALLEAMMLGVPVVATDIPSNRCVLTEGASGLLINVGVEGLYRGMEQALTEELCAPTFDPVAYNTHAIIRFYSLVAGDIDAVRQQ